jgi:TonB-dependent receptor-like protein
MGELLIRLFVAAPLLVLSQGATGELRVQVSDAAGLAVATTFQLTSESNQLHETIATDQAGRAVVRQLPDGIYHLRIEPPGFAARTDIVEIRSAVPREIHIVLTPAPLQVAVTVSAGETLVDPRQTTMIARIGRDTIADRLAPLPGRSLLELVSMQPGWLLEANGILHPRGSEYQTQYLIDGVPLTDNRSPAFLPDLDADTVQALRVMTASYPAEYGRKLGGVVDVVTRAVDENGVHGRASIYAGSDQTVGESTTIGRRSGRYGLSAGTDVGRTDRFLDPPVTENYTNEGRAVAVFGSGDVSFNEENRVGGTIRRDGADFLVPNERVQQVAGQRQERSNTELAGQLSYQRMLSPRMVADVRSMFRRITAGLTSNTPATPIVAAQQRGYTERYVKSTVSLHAGTHDVKAGGELDFAEIREAFDGRVVDASRFAPGTPSLIAFAGRTPDHEIAFFAQDQISAERWTITTGLRWDRYAVVVTDRALSPRLGFAYDWTEAGLIVRGAYDRVFQTPAFENLLVSSSPGLGDFGPDTVRVPVRPSRGHFFEAGVTRAFFGSLRADVNVYRRSFTDYADDELLLNTGIGFPVSFRGATINGLEARVSVPHWKNVTGSFAYSLLKGVAKGPITGGLFLPSQTVSEGDDDESFPITQDQRHTISTRWRYQLRPPLWLGAGASFGSGLPTELETNVDDLLEAYGAEILERVDFGRHRLKPSTSANVSAGATLRQNGRHALRVQADVSNVFGRLNVINFAGVFSGTAVGAPRRATVRTMIEF